MADDQVDLALGDIPDARFSEEEKGKFTVAHLNFFLKCSVINQNGNLKKTLLERKFLVLALMKKRKEK